MPDPAWVAVGGTIAVNAGLAFYVAGTINEKVRSLMDWRDKRADPKLEEHETQLAKLSVMCPLLHRPGYPHGHEDR